MWSLLCSINDSCKNKISFYNLLSLSNEEKKKKAIKLHCQLWHASKDQLVKLLKDSGIDSKGVLKMIVDCCDNCEFGLKFKKHFSKPVFRFPVLPRFNEYVSMDLKEVEKGNVWILYLIDASTRYAAACWIRRKKSSSVIYFRCRWIIYEHLVNFIAIVAENLQMMYSVKWTKS